MRGHRRHRGRAPVEHVGRRRPTRHRARAALRPDVERRCHDRATARHPGVGRRPAHRCGRHDPRHGAPAGRGGPRSPDRGCHRHPRSHPSGQDRRRAGLHPNGGGRGRVGTVTCPRVAATRRVRPDARRAGGGAHGRSRRHHPRSGRGVLVDLSPTRSGRFGSRPSRRPGRAARVARDHRGVAARRPGGGPRGRHVRRLRGRGRPDLGHRPGRRRCRPPHHRATPAPRPLVHAQGTPDGGLQAR